MGCCSVTVKTVHSYININTGSHCFIIVFFSFVSGSHYTALAGYVDQAGFKLAEIFLPLLLELLG